MWNRRKRQQLSAENKNLFTGESDDDEWIPRSKPRLGTYDLIKLLDTEIT